MNFRVFFMLFVLVPSILKGQQDTLPEFNAETTHLFVKNKKAISGEFLKRVPFKGELAAFALLEPNGKRLTGIVNRQGKIVVAPTYSNAFLLTGDFFALKKSDGYFEFYDKESSYIRLDHCDSFKVENGTVLWADNLKWGALLRKKKGFKIISADYQKIEVNENSIKLKRFNNWVLGKNSFGSNALRYDSIKFITDSILIYDRGGLKGIANINGHEYTKAKFDSIVTIPNQQLKVSINGQKGIMDLQGNFILSCKFKEICLLNENYYKVLTTKNLFKIYNSNGSELTHNEYLEIGIPSEGLISVKTNKDSVEQKWGYVNLKDSIVIPFLFTIADNFHDGEAAVCKGKNCFVINSAGEKIIDSSYFSINQSGLYSKDSTGNKIFFKSPADLVSYKRLNHKVVLVNEKGKYGLLNSNGIEIVPAIYDEIRGPYYDSIIVVIQGNNIGILSANGYFLSDPHDRFEKVDEFKEKRARFVKGGKFGFIDTRGNIRVAPQYKEARDYNEGAAAVLLKGKWAFIDPDESILVQPLYSEVKDFRNGLARCKVGQKWSFVTLQGKQVSSLTYDEIIEANFGKWVIKNGSKLGLADGAGREQLAPRYEYVEDLGNGNVIVKKNGKWGVVDYMENFIIPFEFDFITVNKSKDSFAVMKNGIEELIELGNAK